MYPYHASAAFLFITTTATSKIIEPNTTEASSIQTEASKQPTKGTSTEQGEGTSTEQGEGNNAAGKSDNDGVSSTTIIVPVILVVMLVIVVIILVFWFKRRSTSKLTFIFYKELV